MNLHDITPAARYPSIPTWTREAYLQNDQLTGRLDDCWIHNGIVLGHWVNDDHEFVIHVYEYTEDVGTDLDWRQKELQDALTLRTRNTDMDWSIWRDHCLTPDLQIDPA